MPKQQMTDAAKIADNVVEVWQLGNLAHRWAGASLALSPDELDRYRELCANAKVDPVVLLYRFQQLWREELTEPPRLPELQHPGGLFSPAALNLQQSPAIETESRPA